MLYAHRWPLSLPSAGVAPGCTKKVVYIDVSVGMVCTVRVPDDHAVLPARRTHYSVEVEPPGRRRTSSSWLLLSALQSACMLEKSTEALSASASRALCRIKRAEFYT